MSEVSGMQEVMQVMAMDDEAKVVTKMVARPDKQEGESDRLVWRPV